MTCHHAKGDPNCSSTYGSPAWRYTYTERERESQTPDIAAYTIEAVEQVGPHLVLKVHYPNCKRCSYEGVKVLVYLNVSSLAAMRWRKIDPHFTDPTITRPPTEAPGPSARFPASEDGWRDAIAYAESKRADASTAKGHTR